VVFRDATTAHVDFFDQRGNQTPRQDIEWVAEKDLDVKEIMLQLDKHNDILLDNIAHDCLDAPTAYGLGVRAVAGTGLGHGLRILLAAETTLASVPSALALVTPLDWVTSGGAHLLLMMVDFGRWLFCGLPTSVMLLNMAEHVGGFAGLIGGGALSTYLATLSFFTATGAVVMPYLAVFLAFVCEFLGRSIVRKLYLRKLRRKAEKALQEAKDALGILPTDDYREAKKKYNARMKQIHPDKNPSDPTASLDTIRAIVAWNLVRTSYDSQQINFESEIMLHINTLHVYCNKAGQWILKKVWFTKHGEMPENEKHFPNAPQKNQAETRTHQIFVR
jgi:hypothetical protein